ncbi:MAG: hypothetical protein MZV64_20640 [Ignavibacteriales bacterium]|nr:hypothetical protein [Ignavibacteriales bacterium]
MLKKVITIGGVAMNGFNVTGEMLIAYEMHVRDMTEIHPIIRECEERRTLSKV